MPGSSAVCSGYRLRQSKSQRRRGEGARGVATAARAERSCRFEVEMNWRRQLVCLVFPMVATAQNNSRAVPECASCHSEAKSQPGTSMAHALESVAECKVLIDHPVLTTNQGPYSYRIERTGKQSLYSVSDGAHQLTMSVKWAMGASSAIGQTYILEKDGALYESRVSYFSE